MNSLFPLASLLDERRALLLAAARRDDGQNLHIAVLLTISSVKRVGQIAFLCQ